jgi:hypothetical protein
MRTSLRAWDYCGNIQKARYGYKILEISFFSSCNTRKQGGIMFKLIFATTALLASLSAHAVDSRPIPLKLSAGQARIQADQYYSYDFGIVPLNNMAYRDFNLTANGPGDLYIQQISITAGDFNAFHNCPAVLPAGGYCSIRVRFMPWYEGYSTGRMGIYTNGGTITMDFTGYGRRY